MGIRTPLLSFCLAILLFIAVPLTHAESTSSKKPNPQVLLKTDFGEITLELYAKEAPVTVANFLHYIEDFYYAGTIFHRVVPGFVIQGGGYTFDLVAREPGDPIANESNNRLKNKRGTLAMARFADPDSARAQFYINLADNRNLNAKKDRPGYTVFGAVIDGMEVVDEIAKQPTRRSGKFTHLPKEPIRILNTKLISSE